MEILAEYFDAPPSSREHMILRDECWLGGDLIEVRFYLGRLLKQNLFRESNDDVGRTLIAYLKTTTSAEGAALVADEGLHAWQVVVPVLKYRFESEVEGARKPPPREAAAIEAFLKNPAIGSQDLARAARTTEKQLNRMTDLNLARALPHRTSNRREVQQQNAESASKPA
jgi:hypothetical protein